MKQKNYELGKLGEELARKYLITKNYEIVDSNFQTKYGEIDIVAKDGKTVVFVEVKLKIGDDFGTPEEMINHHKLSQVQNTAMSFLQANPKIDKASTSYRIDAVCIVLDLNHRVERIDQYKNITF